MDLTEDEKILAPKNRFFIFLRCVFDICSALRFLPISSSCLFYLRSTGILNPFFRFLKLGNYCYCETIDHKLP